ncbi:MAG: transposase [Longicatena sp.]
MNFFTSKHIIPIIDINCRRKDKNPYHSFEFLNDDGVSFCLNGNNMVYIGYEAKKHRHKYRCPIAMGKISDCPNKDNCYPTSDYGKIRYIKSKNDIKLFGPIPYKSEKWKEIYKDRTSTERMNNRILNDYRIHSMKIRNRAKFLFFSIFAGINIHHDAQLKCSK